VYPSQLSFSYDEENATPIPLLHLSLTRRWYKFQLPILFLRRPHYQSNQWWKHHTVAYVYYDSESGDSGSSIYSSENILLQSSFIPSALEEWGDKYLASKVI
jgi:hypothetical protein